MENKTFFHEKQKFTQWWLWSILVVPFVYFVLESIFPILFKFNNSEEYSSVSKGISGEYWIILVIMTIVLLFFWRSAMITKINQEKVFIKHLLFFKKEFLWNDIQSAEIVKYPFVGYGIRISLDHGTVYNVKGNMGLLLKLNDGRKRLIGTQKPEELRKVVTEILD